MVFETLPSNEPRLGSRCRRSELLRWELETLRKRKRQIEWNKTIPRNVRGSSWSRLVIGRLSSGANRSNVALRPNSSSGVGGGEICSSWKGRLSEEEEEEKKKPKRTSGSWLFAQTGRWTVSKGWTASFAARLSEKNFYTFSFNMSLAAHASLLLSHSICTHLKHWSRKLSSLESINEPLSKWSSIWMDECCCCFCRCSWRTNTNSPNLAQLSSFKQRLTSTSLPGQVAG